MNLATLESILGTKIERGQLDTGFLTEGTSLYHESDYINPDASTVYKPPLPAMELWKLNPKSSEKSSLVVKNWWNRKRAHGKT
jgi:hypothetical protein